MKALASPAMLAVLALVAALVSHPIFHLSTSEELDRLAVPVAAALLMAALVARAYVERRQADVVLALGALAVLAGVVYDGARGHTGRVALRPSGATRSFEEQGRDGRRLGLRPLGFDLSLQTLGEVEASLGVSASATAPPERLAPGQALSVGRFRLSWLERESRPRLVLGLTRGAAEVGEVELATGAEAAFDDLTIALDRYFPDFALDASNQPFTRSSDPRNPAALVRVTRGDQEWRVFVLRAMPGIHNLPELGYRFSLKAISADASLAIGVHHEPGALLVAAGLALVAFGFWMGARR